MATTVAPDRADINLPILPVEHEGFIPYLASNRLTPVKDLLGPFRAYENELRKTFAQHPEHPAVQQPSVTPIFAGYEGAVNIRARQPTKESQEQRDRYIMPLKDEARKPEGAPAIVRSLHQFHRNLSVFSESSLADVDWSNVVVAGSAAVTPLLTVPEQHSQSKRGLRTYYHEQIAPASDVDLFLYGLTESQAKEKIKQIEQKIRDALLVETTTVRTKNAITIVSQYPVRHVQIVLRIYRSISEILAGFDVDCACVAYDGQQVWAAPRAIAAIMTQINAVDLTRRSPSYENRLAKYSYRGFEVYCPFLDRSRIDPTIFERSFGRTKGLARLLVLEKLPTSTDRDSYLDQRRHDRGRPALPYWRLLQKRQTRGNIKDKHEQEIPEWVDSDEISDYHTFTIPYGPKIHARKLEKLFYVKDLLLNAEWNQPKDRKVNLHRHPGFFGPSEMVMQDCCGYCPQPSTVEEGEVAEVENKTYISGEVSFLKHDPGRQAIGSFNPLDAKGWTEMAYVGDTFNVCKAIVDGDAEFVQSWLDQDGNDPNTRDHTGRTPLHLAVATSTLGIIQALVDHGARLVARVVDGRTALHIAAHRGDARIVSCLLRKSEANEAEELTRQDARRKARMASTGRPRPEVSTYPDDLDEDIDVVDHVDAESGSLGATTDNSLIKIPSHQEPLGNTVEAEKDDGPDVYDIDVLAWDVAFSALHVAIVKGHVEVVKTLVEDFGSDVLLPVKIFKDQTGSADSAILTLGLALGLDIDRSEEMVRVLVGLGASCAQADLKQRTAFMYCVASRPALVNVFLDADETGAMRAIKHLSASGTQFSASVFDPLSAAIASSDGKTALLLLEAGARPVIDFSAFMKAWNTVIKPLGDSKSNKRTFERCVEQPIVEAVRCELPEVAVALLEQFGVDANTLTRASWGLLQNDFRRSSHRGKSVLDKVQKKISKLRQWKPDSTMPGPPEPLRNDGAYLDLYPNSTYVHWSARKQLGAAKADYRRKWEDYVSKKKEAENTEGVAEKQAAIHDLIQDYTRLEAALVRRGAKTFYELHPEIEMPDDDRANRHRYTRIDSRERAPWNVEFNFQQPDLTEEANKRYIGLFQASWEGNESRARELSFVPWEQDGEQQAPCEIATRDQHNMSPFSIAVIRGHLGLAKVILEIAEAQHTTPPEIAVKRHYEMDEDEEMEGSSDEEIRTTSRAVDEEFTVEGIGESVLQAKSLRGPLDILNWSCPIASFVTREEESTVSAPFRLANPARKSQDWCCALPEPVDLLQLAIWTDDRLLFKFLLELMRHYFDKRAASQDVGQFSVFRIEERHFDYAIRLDRKGAIAEMIKLGGAGVPLVALAEEAGIDVHDHPKTYKGLSVYGKKRRDWAAAWGGPSTYGTPHTMDSPLTKAIRSSAIECTDWLLSEAPVRCYLEFGSAAEKSGDNHLRHLLQSGGGFESMVIKFLGSSKHVALHECAALNKREPLPEDLAMLHHLLKVLPECLESKDADELGATPLAMAFTVASPKAASVLVDAGANQCTRNDLGENLLHALLSDSRVPHKKPALITQMLELIDKRLPQSLFTQRTYPKHGSTTPLSRWVGNGGSKDESEDGCETLRVLLKYGEGAELAIIDGAGSTPLHHLLGSGNVPLSRVLLERSPELIHRENSTGRTPYEVMQDQQLARHFKGPPEIKGERFKAKKDIITESPRDFVGIGEAADQKQSIDELFEEVRSKLEAAGQSKRRLVTLNEANEVARRLAAVYRG